MFHHYILLFKYCSFHLEDLIIINKNFISRHNQYQQDKFSEITRNKKKKLILTLKKINISSLENLISRKLDIILDNRYSLILERIKRI